MPIIKPEKISKNVQLRTRINLELYKNLDQYCKWAEISQNHFVQEAITYVLSKDKEWQKVHQKN